MTRSTSHELRIRGRLRPCIAVALCTVFGCAEAPPRHEGADPRAAHHPLSSTAQALSADPGPKNLFSGGYLSSYRGQTHSDETYVYVHYYRDGDRYCWGNVLRKPIGGGAAASARAPCGTRGVTILNDSAYFAVVQTSQSNTGETLRGIYRSTFSVDGGAYLPVSTTLDALSIGTDGHYLYWNDSAAALHRMLPDGQGDVILATNAAVVVKSQGAAKDGEPLIVDDSAVYGYDGAELWRVPKQGGEKTTLATVGASISALQLDGGELFWIDGGTRIERLPVTGGTPSTFHEATFGMEISGFFGLAVAQGWVYWTVDSNLERRATTGGAIETIDTAERGAVVHGADATNVYYVRQTMFPPPSPELRRLPVADLVAPVCGRTPRGLVDAAGPLGLAAAGTWVYFTEADDVRRVWKNGGSVETVELDQPGARALHTNADGLDGVAWVTDEGVNSYQFGPGLRAAADDAKDVFAGAKDPAIFAAPKLYYIDGARVVGPADTTLAIGLAPYRLAGDESWLYWTDRGDQTVSRVPRAGGSVEVLARVTSGEIGDLELDFDTDEIIFSVDDGDEGRILRVPTAGGGATLVAEGAFSPFALEAAGSSVFFTSQGPDAGTLHRVAKRGGTTAVLVEGGAARELDTLGDCVFYATDTGIEVVADGTCSDGDACDAGACLRGDDLCDGGAAPDAAVTPADAGGTSGVDGGADGESAADAGGGSESAADAGGSAEGAADAGGGSESAADAGGGTGQGTGGGGEDAEGTADDEGARDGGGAGGDEHRNHRWGCGVLGMHPARAPAGLGSVLLLLLLARLRRRGL